MIVYFLAALQVAAVPPDSQASKQEEQVVIWRDFRTGMTPEQFAESLRKAEGIKLVEVLRKDRKFVKMKIEYDLGNGINIGDLKVAVAPSFVNDRLKSINSSELGCYSVMKTKLENLVVALGDKYPQQQRVKVVDSDGVSIDVQRAFYNQEARVTVSILWIDNPYPQHLYGGSGFLAAANKLANSMADTKYNSTLKACPADNGLKAKVQLNYVSQNDFIVEHNRQTDDRAVRAKATKDGLSGF